MLLWFRDTHAKNVKARLFGPSALRRTILGKVPASSIELQNYSTVARIRAKPENSTVVAVDGDGTPALTKMAADAGIPIVYANHPPADVDSLPESAAFVGSNETDLGTLETKEVCRLLGGKGAVYVLMGRSTTMHR